VTVLADTDSVGAVRRQDQFGDLLAWADTEELGQGGLGTRLSSGHSIQKTAMSQQAVRGGLGNQSAYLIQDCLIVAVFTCRTAPCSAVHRGRLRSPACQHFQPFF
jgi:hypothetical protein